MNEIRSHLGLKLLLSFLLVILIGMLVLFLTARISAPLAYQRHLQFMEQELGGMGMMGQGQGQGQGGAGRGMMSGFYRDFQASFTEALLIAAAASALVAVAVALLLSRQITSPLQQMAVASQRIAEGHYAERVQVSGTDELAQLAKRFNQMAAQLEHVESMRRRLIGDVAHELRTPLTTISGSMEGLLDGMLPATPETFEQVHREAARLNRLVDDLQELSRVEAGAFPLELRKVELAPLVQAVLDRLAPQAQERHISLQSAPSDKSVKVFADPDRVEQVLTNLVSNALRYSPEGASVAISLVRREAMAQVSVRDTGIGIPAEHLAHIFDRFYRVDKSRSRAQGGSGIGLTIARHLVENQGGKLWAESPGEGQGSTFSFTLPLAPQ